MKAAVRENKLAGPLNTPPPRPTFVLHTRGVDT